MLKFAVLWYDSPETRLPELECLTDGLDSLFDREMGRTPGCTKPKAKSKPNRKRDTKPTRPGPAKPRGAPPTTAESVPSPQGSPLRCEYSDNGKRLTFHLPNGSSYTISPADSSPEHFWGTIYSAEWSHPSAVRNCTCAIKASDFILQTSEGEDARKEYRRPRVDFEREVRTFQNTKHRNVLQMYDFWEWDGRGYIAMKKLKGSLGDILYEPEYHDLLQGIRQDETVLAELIRQILTGLDHLHSRNIIYRDVKPDNLLISAHPRIKLADFGNVEILPNQSDLVRGLEGTISYMSPEMRRGSYYNTKTDIWSLGMTLLNLLFHDEEDFPNFDLKGMWAARTYANEQCYESTELKEFMSCLFRKSSERPSAKELLEHPFMHLTNRDAFKELFDRFPQQNLALPVLSKRVRPDTPPPTPDRKSVIPTDIDESIADQEQECSSRFTPPITPSPSPSTKIVIKIVSKKSAKRKKTTECVPIERSKKVLRSGLIV